MDEEASENVGGGGAPALVGRALDPCNVALMVIVAGTRLRQRAESDLRAVGLTLRHLSALGHLSRESGLSYSELARRAGITVQSMQATLGELERREAVEHTTEPGRGRASRLRLTSAGQRLLAAGQQVLDALDDQFCATLGADERAAAEVLFRRALADPV